MKWWGWGEESISFTHADKPGLAPFIKKHIDVDLDAPVAAPPEFSALDVPPSMAGDDLRSALVAIVGAEHVVDDAHDRVVHTYGKSLRDLLRIRAGNLGRLPDLVVYPGSEDDVVAVMNVAIDANAVLIPFGGGTNISGSLEAPVGETRPVLSVDMGRMDRVLDVDEISQIARVQAGVLGPALEEQLNARGWTMGHFPDSFRHSTLGGWIATRSSGMQSDKYGDIAEVTKAVNAVTPAGVLKTRAVPSASTGPSVREMILGSEGRLGIITEATVQVHRLPAQREILAYLFPDWSRALRAMREIAASDASPSVTRVSDAAETQFSFATKKAESGAGRIKSRLTKRYLRLKGIDVSRMCLSFIGYEGSPDHVATQKKLVGEIVSAHGGLSAGTGPGKLYDQKKFDTPYIRDFLLDRGAFADVSETAAPWALLEPLHEGIVSRATKAFEELGVPGYVMCHLSHSYHSGACLYFTFAFKKSDGMDAVEQYEVVKSAIQQGFMDLGATLSHHHAVGTEHSRWLEQDISPAGVAMVNALFRGIDPGRNLNPGKITGQ